MLKDKGSKSSIMHKVYRNKTISKTRWVVEIAFGSLKRWFSSRATKLKDKDKVHSIHVLEAIAHNLKRSSGLECQITKN
ncbi:transposase [Tenacibaculum tangerinum]|uniref:Transposase n=1 Tax=Tenacibaculum tangerinum TaxID=3038772 RepID=A0ABY8L3J0_9FLAO|nr:transposase [Tenacibaculum tangerinum]WGH74773.1 transposase [Tenacibaculum tangerinum]